MIRLLLWRCLNYLAKHSDVTVCRFANDTDDVPPWDDYGYQPNTTTHPEESA